MDIILNLIFFAMFSGAGVTPNQDVYALIHIDHIGHASLQKLKEKPEWRWWVEADDQLLVLTTKKSLADLDLNHRILPIKPNPNKLAMVNLPLDHDWGPCHILTVGGRQAVVQWKKPGLDDLEERGHHHGAGFHQHNSQRMDFIPNMTLACQIANLPSRTKKPKNEALEALLDDINTTRWFFDMYELQCLNRFTFNPDNIVARNYLVDQFNRIPGLEVSTQEFPIGDAVSENVIAVLPGTQTPDEWIIIGAHFDSISPDPEFSSPGAEDNASGTAAVLEMARFFARHRPEKTLVFICYSGEEQFLIGSFFHAESLTASGDNAKVQAMLNMDMIAFSEDDDLDVLLETDTSVQFMIDALSDAAANYTNLNISISFNPSGSDHVPYLVEGMPALLVIENDWFRYPSYHQVDDRIENVLDTTQGGYVLRMNIAAIAELANLNL